MMYNEAPPPQPMRGRGRGGMNRGRGRGRGFGGNQGYMNSGGIVLTFEVVLKILLYGQ